MILHLGTQIQVVFGVVDAEGNVQKKPYTIQVDKLDKTTWDTVFAQLVKLREEVK